MDKYAAEKIAQQAYNAGIELALQKIANIRSFSEAMNLASRLSDQTAKAGDTLARSGLAGKVTRHIPGTSTRNAYKTLQATGAKGNVPNTINALKVRDQMNRLPSELSLTDTKLFSRLNQSKYSPYVFSPRHDPFYAHLYK